MSLKNLVYWGYIFKTHGVTGSFLIKIEHDLVNEINENEPVFLEIEGKPVPFFPTENSVRWKSEQAVYFHFNEIQSLQEAEELISTRIYISPESIDNKEKETSLFPLQNFRLYNQEDILIGSILELIDIKNNPILKVKHNNNKELLIPYVEAWIITINKEGKSLKMNFLEGLLEL